MFDAGLERADFFSGAAVDGEILADRLVRGSVPAAEALRLAIEIGALLHRVHSRGLVHGAISTYSICSSADGIHLLRRPALSRPSDAPYRSPEQVRGEALDSRSDIFSFGAVIYELACGKRPFAGQGASLDRAILQDATSPILTKAGIPAALEGVIAGCLEKDRNRRRQRIQTAVTELKLSDNPLVRPEMDRVRRTPVRPEQAPPLKRAPAPSLVSANSARAAAQPDRVLYASPSSGIRRLVVLSAIGVVLGVSVVAASLYLHHAPPVIRFTGQIAPPTKTTYPGAPSVSPNGRYLTFSALGPQGARMLWLRPLDSNNATPISGTEGAIEPFWSPDNQYIAFFANQSLYKVRVPDGPVTAICKAQGGGGGSWNRDGVILFAPGSAGGLYRVSPNGGSVQSVTRLASSNSERAHLWPQFLPDGVHFLFFAFTGTETGTGVYAGSLDSTKSQRIMTAEANAVYCQSAGGAGDGRLLFIRDHALLAQRFNISNLALEGQPAELATGMSPVLSLALAPLSVSENAVLVYQMLGDPTRQLVWMDRSGKQLATADQTGDWAALRISPDGSRAVAARIAPGEKKAELWIVEAGGRAVQITASPSHEGSPVWSPDGTRIAFFADQSLRKGQTGTYELFVKPASEASKMESLYVSPVSKYPTDWSHDGRYVLFGSIGEGTFSDIWVYSIPERRATPILNTVYGEGYAVLSQDGKWLAYQSDESGRNEIYVQPFNPTTNATQRRWQVSTGGGALPRWRSDARELFYMGSDGALMAATVSTAGDGFHSDTPHLLFQTRPLPRTPWNLYDVSPDGKRFLVNLPLEWSSSAPINVAVNWSDKLRN